MKVGRIEIGRGATVGTSAIILYDSTVGEFARLGPLTVVMKGEYIPPHTTWSGAPAKRTASAEVREDVKDAAKPSKAASVA
jgi:acetyltransferase-like isoleucine patch superfamily enzyme